MSSSEVTIQIKESQASRPFIEVFEEDQKLWEVFKFAESHLGAGAMLWNVNSQEIYTSGSKALKKSLQDLGLTGNVTFMGVRKERIPRVPMRLRPIRREAGAAGGAADISGASYDQESDQHSISLEERKQRAKQFLKEKREEDTAAAIEEAREKEKERRRIGQELMREKIKKEREEMKEISESISRKKASKKAELEAIRAQIARDKEDRKREKEVSVSVQPTTKPAVPSVRDGKVKIKIKFEDMVLLKTFEETDLLSVVVEFIKQEAQQDVLLSNTYPRKDYKSDDMEQSLASLGLGGSVSLVAKRNVVPPENISECSTEQVSN